MYEIDDAAKAALSEWTGEMFKLETQLDHELTLFAFVVSDHLALSGDIRNSDWIRWDLDGFKGWCRDIVYPDITGRPWPGSVA